MTTDWTHCRHFGLQGRGDWGGPGSPVAESVDTAAGSRGGCAGREGDWRRASDAAILGRVGHGGEGERRRKEGGQGRRTGGRGWKKGDIREVGNEIREQDQFKFALGFIIENVVNDITIHRYGGGVSKIRITYGPKEAGGAHGVWCGSSASLAATGRVRSSWPLSRYYSTPLPELALNACPHQAHRAIVAHPVLSNPSRCVAVVLLPSTDLTALPSVCPSSPRPRSRRIRTREAHPRIKQEEGQAHEHSREMGQGEVCRQHMVAFSL